MRVLLGLLIASLGAACTGKATTTSEVTATGLVVPSCSSPAPVLNAYDPGAAGYLVKLREGRNVEAQSVALANNYSLKVNAAWEFIGTFHASMSPANLAKLRCDSRVEFVEFNSSTHADGRAT